MKLVAAPEEAGNGRGSESAGHGCWHRVDNDHERYAGELLPETRIVADIHIGEDYGRAQGWTLRDRPARDDEDFGDVFKGGELVGKVERVEGSLVVYRENDSI